MAQKLYEDKIGTLSESGGTISLAPSRLTIGGQQYVTQGLTVAATVASANTRYQIYAVLSGGVPILVVSSNENSVGPASYVAWKLVGSYYTNGLSSVGFGSFVSIEGAPVSGSIEFLITGQNFGTITDQGSNYYRQGSKMYVETRFGTGTHVAAPAQINIPGTRTIKKPIGQQVCGYGASQGGSIYSFPILATANSYFLFGQGESGGGQLSTVNASQWSNANILSFTAEVEIAGWDNTPIKDL